MKISRTVYYGWEDLTKYERLWIGLIFSLLIVGVIVGLKVLAGR